MDLDILKSYNRSPYSEYAGKMCGGNIMLHVGLVYFGIVHDIVMGPDHIEYWGNRIANYSWKLVDGWYIPEFYNVDPRYKKLENIFDNLD